MTQEHDLRIVARTAELTASADTDDEWRFGGVAVGENDILYTDDGTAVLFTPEILEAASHTQAGEPLTIDHPQDENGAPLYPPPLDESWGRVTKAGYVPGRGMVYESTTHNEDIADGVKAGSYDVSVHPRFDLGEQDPETGAYLPENVVFQDLSVVSKGMSEANTAEWGANGALASWTRQADIGAEIDAHAPSDPEPDSNASREGLIASTVKATLTGLGLSTTAITADADESDSESESEPESDEAPAPDADESDGESPADEQPSDESAEADTDTRHEDEPTPNMSEEDPDNESEQEQEQERTPEDGDQTDTKSDGVSDEDVSPEDGVEYVTKQDFDDFAKEIKEAMLTQGDAVELHDEALAQKQKSEKVEEIIAESPQYDEEDREDLMASADTVVDNTHATVTGGRTARLPGSAGVGRSIQASYNDDDDEETLDDYGTGVHQR